MVCVRSQILIVNLFINNCYTEKKKRKKRQNIIESQLSLQANNRLVETCLRYSWSDRLWNTVETAQQRTGSGQGLFSLTLHGDIFDSMVIALTGMT